jgi:hypothetical protein
LLLLLVAAIEMSSRATSTPAIRDRLDLSIAQMALVLFGLSLGSMLGIRRRCASSGAHQFPAVVVTLTRPRE